MHPQVVGQTFVYQCGGAQDPFQLVLRNGPGEIALWLPPRFGRPYLVLGQRRAASGARYEGDGVLVWTHGATAIVEVDDQSFGECVLDRQASIWERAKLDGIDFRGTGNEPGWTLEIRDGRQIRLLYDYGQHQIEAPCPMPAEDRVARRSVYSTWVDDRPLKVILSAGPCHDTMDDQVYATRVRIDWEGRTFEGCGRPLH